MAPGHVVHTIWAKDCSYLAVGGQWTKATAFEASATLEKCCWFDISGKTNSKLKKVSSLIVGFEISIGDGTPGMKSFDIIIEATTDTVSVQKQINKMEPYTKTWVSYTFPMHNKPFTTLDISLRTNGDPSVEPKSGLTFYEAKVEEIGEE